MAVIRVNKTKNYTVMSNYHLKDKNLSLKAKGLLSVMLSLPDNWDYSIAGLVAICCEKESAVNSTLGELKKYKYLYIKKLMPNQTESGRIEYIYNIYEYPHEETESEKQEVEKQGLENQGVEILGVENQDIENQGQYNTNNKNTKELNTNKENMDNDNDNERIVPRIVEEAKTTPKDILELYNSICVSLPKAVKLTSTRERYINGRLNEKEVNIDTFRDVFTKAENSDFLKGNNDRGFHADFDWLINQNNFYKTLEGKYENKRFGQPKQEKQQDTLQADYIENGVKYKRINGVLCYWDIGLWRKVITQEDIEHEERLKSEAEEEEERIFKETGYRF